MQSLQRKGAQLLEVTLTLADCRTEETADRVWLLKDGWKRLTAGLPTLAGAYRWVEVTAADDEPELENIHLHGAFDIRLNGRDYIRRDEWQQHWRDRWREAVGPEARSAHVTPIRGLEEYASYMADSEKFQADVDLAIGDPERFIHRAEQLSNIRYRFHGTGSLAVN